MSKHPTKSGFDVNASHHLTNALTFLSGVQTKEDGRVSWNSSSLDDGTFEVIYSLKFKPQIDDHVKDGAIWHVLNECAHAEDFSTTFFLKRIRAFLRDFGKKPTQKLVGVGQINCKLDVGLPKSMLSFDGKVEFTRHLTSVDSAALSLNESSERNKLGLHDGFVYIITRVDATDHRSAIDRAERNINYALGVLNLVHHGYGISKRFGYPNAPIGRFLSASSIFLVDRKSRKLGHYFSDNNYPQKFKDSFSVWQKLDETGTEMARHYVNDLKYLDYSEKVIQAVILFQEGLEATSIDLALLKFWTGIELLCSKDEREVSDKIIERASSIFINPKHAARRLQFIQAFRNKIVHKGASGEHALLCAQWGSVFLAEIIRFCLFNKHRLRKHHQVLQYMSMPINQTDIEQIILLSRKRRASLKTKDL